MPSIWSFVAIALVAALVAGTMVSFFREQEAYARYEWKKGQIERIRAEQEKSGTPENPSSE